MPESALPRGFWQRVQKMIDDSIARYARSGPLRSSAISEGGLTIKGGTLQVKFPDSHGGETAVFFGDLWSTVDGSYLGTGLLIQAEDGTDIASFSTNAPAGTTTAHLHDGGNRIIVANDGNSGMGLARPYIGGAAAAHRFQDFRYSTTSATFETVSSWYVTKQHPRLRVTARASMDTAGTTGEMRVLVNSVQLGSTTAEGFAISTRDFGPEPIAGDHMERVFVELQGRRTSASGTLKIEPMGWEAQQS